MAEANDEQKFNDDLPNKNCKAVQYMFIDIVECLVGNSKCPFSKNFGYGLTCNHSLRKEIAKRTLDEKRKM